MKKVGMAFCFLFLAYGITCKLQAQSPGTGEVYAWWEEFPYQPDPNLTKEERRAYNRAYKAAVEARLRELGLTKTQPASQKVVTERRENNDKTIAKRVPGTSITYHSGALSAGGTTSQMLGNQFNSALNQPGTGIFPIEASGSVTMATFDMIAVAGGAAFFSMYHQLMGTTAPQITSVLHSGLAAGLNTITINPVSTSNAYTGGTFLAGIWRIAGDTPAIATGTVMGQGFHAIDINDGMPGNMFAVIPNMNAAFAVTGNLTTPVELMNFKVE